MGLLWGHSTRPRNFNMSRFLNLLKGKKSTPGYVDIVFTRLEDGLAGSGPTFAFVEVENEDRESIRLGRWVHRDDGYDVLRILKGVR